MLPDARSVDSSNTVKCNLKFECQKASVKREVVLGRKCLDSFERREMNWFIASRNKLWRNCGLKATSQQKFS